MIPLAHPAVAAVYGTAAVTLVVVETTVHVLQAVACAAGCFLSFLGRQA